MNPQELARALQLLLHREAMRGGWHRDNIACKGLPLEKQCSLCLMLQIEKSGALSPRGDSRGGGAVA